MAYKVGDKVRILDAKKIMFGKKYWEDGDVTKVKRVLDDGRPCLSRNTAKLGDRGLALWSTELQYIEKVEESDAKMTQFKVGDKVRVIADEGDIAGVKIGTIATVTEVDSDGDVRLDVINKNGVPAFFLAREVELVSPKQTKNQRLTSAEQAISTLEQKVEAMQTEIDALKAAQKPPVTTIADAIQRYKERTPNQKRKKIIDEAKAFVEDAKNFTGNVSRRKGYKYASTNRIVCDVEFNVNAEKRTVVALLKYQYGGRVVAKAIAKCAPDDVFSADIGKAIALGRALGLDVERFEKAVQPTEFAVGQVTHTTRGSFVGTPLKITKIDGDMAYTNPGRFHFFDEIDIVNITDDTEAQY